MVFDPCMRPLCVNIKNVMFLVHLSRTRFKTQLYKFHILVDLCCDLEQCSPEDNALLLKDMGVEEHRHQIWKRSNFYSIRSLDSIVTFD